MVAVPAAVYRGCGLMGGRAGSRSSNLLDSLGWAVSVAASAYGVGRLATGHHTAHDIAILIVGLAAGALRLRAAWRVFALLSDGECDEGSTWEAALLAPPWKLSHLPAIVDYNKIQSLGRVEEVVPLEPLADKWRAFGWDTREVDGHDIAALLEVLDPARSLPGQRPRCIIAHTVKGKGVSFMEDDLLWHYRTPKGEEYQRALAELERGA